LIKRSCGYFFIFCNLKTRSWAWYDELERVVLPLYYNDRKGFIKVMSYAIALNCSFFNAQRTILEHASAAYLR